MATKRKRSAGTWEYVVKRKGLLPKPLHLTFASEEEGDRYVAHLEKLLDQGVVPAEFLEKTKETINTIGQSIVAYLAAVHTTEDDVIILNALKRTLNDKELSEVKYTWAEEWVKGLRASKQAPSTIRKKVGALARCLDWVVRREDTMLLHNPLRVLPKRYATTEDGRKDVERDRRVEKGEEPRIMAILNKEKPEGRERAFALPEADSLKLMFTAAIESAMRMREIYTITDDQVSFDESTIFLDQTKNGSKRQVPMSSVLHAAMREYMTKNAAEIKERDGRIFPFWDGSLVKAELRKTSGRLSSQWERIFSAAKCDDLHFHDLRHEATSRLYERTKLSDVEIAKITGHSSTKMLMRYANLRGSNLASRMW